MGAAAISIDQRNPVCNLTPDELAILRDSVLNAAVEARHDIAKFFEFVMREEHTRAPIKLKPHQKLGLQFMMDHDFSVNIWPVDHAKTFTMTGLTLYLLGQDPTLRGAVVSAAQAQAEKIVRVVRDYIETSVELRLVFPELKPSRRDGDPWTQSQLTVQRPSGIKDPSLVAIGIDSKTIIGSRLSWVVVDDILNLENTRTKEQREKVYTWFDSSVLSRVDRVGGRVVVTNTPWHPKDLLHELKRQGRATLRMSIDGDIEIQDSKYRLAKGHAPWDSHLIRPANDNALNPICRLVAYDPDPENKRRLWPERFTDDVVEMLQFKHLPPEYNRLYRTVCRDDDTALCKVEYIERCKLNARQEGIYSMVAQASYELAFTGVDLAIREGEEFDDTALVTFGIRPHDRRRVVLDIEAGQWPAPVILQKIHQKHEQYGSIIVVENNHAQDYIRQFALAEDITLPIVAHHTGKEKLNLDYGIPGIFLELSNGAWLLPNDRHGHVHRNIARLIDACLYYSPSKHTDDVLMALYVAWMKAKKFAPIVKNIEALGTGTKMLGMALTSR